MAKRVLIFGIGKFGSAVANEFINNSNIDLELIDQKIDCLSPFKKHNIPLHSLNSQEIDNIKSLDIDEQDFCLLLYGDDITASILTCQNLLDLKINNIYVRVINESHKKIISSLGITKFIDTNSIVSRQLALEITRNLTFIVSQKEYSIYRVINKKIDNKNSELLDLKNKYQTNIILIKRNVEENENKVSHIIPDDKTNIFINDELLLLIIKGYEEQVNKLFQ